MIRVLIIALCFFWCTHVNNQEENVSKSALVIGHYQSVEGSIIPDSTKNSDYPVLCIDPCSNPECERTLTRSMDRFVINSMNESDAVFFSKVAFNIRYIHKDLGGSHYQQSIAQFPFNYSVTRYNGTDSCRLHIDSIQQNTGRVYMRANNAGLSINVGDTVNLSDTLFVRTDSSYCWQKLIITHKIINYGVSVLPDKRFSQFF